MTWLPERLQQHWFVACSADDIRARTCGTQVLGIPLVVYRSRSGIVAAEDRCPHRNAPLSHGRIQNGNLVCPYHGWRFNAAGKCVEAPGASDCDPPSVGLHLWNVRESEGWIWVRAANGAEDRLPYRPSLADDQNYQSCTLTNCVESTLADALENLLDATHTPYVHSGLIRSAQQKQTFTAKVRRHDDFVEAEYRGERGQSGLISRWFEPEREVSFGRFIPPCTAELEYRSKARTELLVVAHFTPTCEGSLKVYVRCYLPNSWLPNSVRFAVIQGLFGRVLSQDKKILELQRWNIRRFGKHQYVDSRADLLRPWIDAWINEGEFPPQADGPQSIQFHI